MCNIILKNINNTVPKQTDIYIETLKKSNLPVYFFGTGLGKVNIKKLLDDNNINIDCFIVDDNSYYQGMNIDGKPIFPLSYVLNTDTSINIVMADTGYTNKTNIMESMECPSKRIFYVFDGMELISPFPDFYNYVNKNISGFEETYNQLADELSKKILIEYLNAKISANPKELSALNVNKEKQYLPSFFKMDHKEVLLDCGAYDGDFTLVFSEIFKYKAIYAFECDTENVKKLKKNTSHLDNIQIIEKGCWSEKANLSFLNHGTMASKIDNDGQKKIEADSIDNIILTSVMSRKRQSKSNTSQSDVKDEVTFIKMDVEGAELEALKGAKNTILKYAPKMAISVYHLKDDLISIPQYILSLNKNYKLYLRHYGSFSSELILYAKPKQVKS